MKNKFGKRVMAYILSGVMIMSCMPQADMTVFASEASEDAAEAFETKEEALTDEASTEESLAEETLTDEALTEEASSVENEESNEEEEAAVTSQTEDEKTENGEESDDDAETADESLQEFLTESETETETEASQTEEELKDDQKHTVWFVGDSTVCSFTDAYYYPRYGYGTQLENYLDENYYTVNNLAKSGSSSLNYPSVASEEYAELKNGISEGDVLIIGFGHNDEKKAAERYTNPNGDWQTDGSFAKSLYDSYVSVALDAKATPILCTPIVRRNAKGEYTGTNIHVTSDGKGDDGNQYEGGDYPAAIRKLGEDKNISVVDLTSLTKELYENAGVDKTLYMHAWTSSKETSVDNTHLNIYGAKKVAYMLAKEISEMEALDIAAHIKNLETEPTQEKDLTPNPNYDVDKDGKYTPPTEDSKLWDNYGIFKGSAFGSLGSKPAADNYTFGKDENDNMHIAVMNDKGKIAASEDGIAMYYYQIPAASTFTLTAKAAVNSIAESNQAAFGLMARDNMYIDTNDKTLIGDYVAAATFGTASVNCFMRKDSALKKGESIEAPVAGKTYNLSIIKNTDGYACTFGDNTPQSQGYDFQLTACDSEYQYIGMFAARNADITFSDIKLTVDGKEVNIGVGSQTLGENPDTEESSSEEGSTEESSSEESSTEESSTEEGSSEESSTEESSPEEGSTEESSKEESSTEESGTEESSPEESSTEEIADTEESKITADTSDKVSISDTKKIKVEAANLMTSKKPQYAVAVTYIYTDKDGKTYKQQLTEGIHYTVALVKGYDGISAGTQKVTVTGTDEKTDLGTFTGKKTVSYTLENKKETEKKDISRVKLSLNKADVKNAVYTGAYITPAVEGLEAIGEENYTLVYKNNVNAGKASVTINGCGEYYGSKALSFTIKAADISKQALTLEASNVTFAGNGKTYTAKEKENTSSLVYKGSAIVFNGLSIKLNGIKLNTRTDYTVTYKNNAKTGNAAATIKGMNNLSGSIKITYAITADETVSDAIKTFTAENPLPAEYSSKGARLTEIKLINGVTLKEGTDYKVNYKGCKKASELSIGDTESVLISGAGSYKNAFKNIQVYIKTQQGAYHVKDGAVADTSKTKGDAAKLINAAKITDAAGVKIKAQDVTISTTNNTITVAPKDAVNYKETVLICRVAGKLAGVKQKTVPVKYFDGVNPVTFTETELADLLSDVSAKDIVITSYKNNNKIGTASVTIEGRPTGAYYGIKTVKFKISAKPAELGKDAEEEAPETEESSGTEESSEPEDSDTIKNQISVWDFGGVEESDTEAYKNNVTIAFWDDFAGLGTDGKLTVTSVELGDLTITCNANDRIYSASDKKSAGAIPSYGAFAYDDGYTAKGCYYANGTGGDSRRLLTINNASAGDRIDVYMGTSNSKITPVCFEYLGTEGEQKDTVDLGTTNSKLSFVAKYSGSYKIWADASGGKPVYNRAVKVPAAAVKGTVDFGALASTDGVSLKFVNDTTKAETQAVLSGTDFTAKLAAGYTYTAVLSGATGYGFTNATKKVTVTDEDVLKGKRNVALVAEAKETYVYSGTIKGFAEGYDISALKVILKADPDTASDDAELKISDGLAFTVTLEPDVEYTLTLEGVNDYEITSEKTINKNSAYTADIEVALKELFEAKGSFVDIDGNEISTVTSVKFVNVDDEYEYEADVSGSEYTVSLRNGAYSVQAAAEGYATTTHVVVEDKAVTKDLLFVSTAEESDLTRVLDLYVGYSDKGAANYETVSAAVKAAKRMKPSAESERITIHIAPGTYREQIIVEAPYITFTNDEPDKEVKLTWYYGIGYQYYSANDNGYYDAERAYDKYERKAAARWGCCVRVTGDYFKAENITFENSFNIYITDEELEDGVKPEGSMPERNYALDVKSKAATERAAALAADCKYSEFYNCSFLSSQDTLYTGGKDSHSYYKNCFIEGQTDYIFGDGDIVFDNCELSWKGYSTGSTGGYITANKDEAANGYLFRNCTVTGNEKLTVTPGYFGRNWGEKAKAAFVNTKLETADIITGEAWATMNGNVANANYKEYNTSALDGKEMPTSELRKSKQVSENPASDLTVYFGDWTPSYYTAESATAEFEKNPEITDNGDINVPKPGHTLTVKYSLGESNNSNDASVIKWYRVKDETETLIKTTTAVVSRSYKVQKDDVGSKIKVVVAPTLTSGKSGTEASDTTKENIQEGWEEPGMSDAVIGEGINIFLAGDSTVKDYSSKGIYNNGAAQDLGSWGEYLQSFFDDEQVTIVNYANGGRSARNFINKGEFDKMAEKIGEGDYLFIQFGHNDCSANYPDRFVPVGEPDKNGKYPVTAGTKGSDGEYSYDCGGTFKWFLKLYVDLAKEKGAIPVLVTPVSRMYYNSDGTIKPHHDCSADTSTGNTYESSDNAYVKAVKQLAEEENVLLIDAFELTKGMYEKAYKDDTAAGSGSSDYGSQLMGIKDGTAIDKTHCNKLGGFITAAYITKAVRELKDAEGKAVNIASAIKAPKGVGGVTTDNKTVFTVNNSGTFTAYDKLKDYGEKADYWTTTGTELILDAVGTN